MSLWNKLKKGLGVGAKIATAVAPLVTPQYAPIIAVVSNAVIGVERKWGRGNGQQKALAAQEEISNALPVIIAHFEQEFGRELADEEKLREGLTHLQEAHVKIANAFKVLK